MPRRPDRRGWRLTASLAVLAYAATAGASGLDRLAATHFSAEQMTPGAFRVQAEARAADRLIEAGIPESAYSGAARLVARDPLGTGSTALLGAALFGRGETAEADRAFRLSARRGWRDARTQIYWLRVANAQGDYSLAALRFGALARQWPRAPAIAQIAQVFEANPTGRRALAERIAAGDRWAATYVQPDEALSATQLKGRAEVLLAVSPLGRQLGCGAIAPLIGRLVESDALLAAKLWQGHCPRAGAPGTVGDPGFEDASFAGPRVAFEWAFPGNGALQVDLIAQGGKGQSLQVANRGAATLPFAAQRLLAGGGQHEFTVEGETGSGTLFASLSCQPEFGQAAPKPVIGAKVTLSFAGDCAAPWLQFWLAPGGAVRIDSVDLLERVTWPATGAP